MIRLTAILLLLVTAAPAHAQITGTATVTRAIHLKAFSYQTIKNILASGFDQMPLPIPQESNTASISHDNIRGSNYYINSTEDYPCSPSKPSIN